jgi:hypothetical protein
MILDFDKWDRNKNIGSNTNLSSTDIDPLKTYLKRLNEKEFSQVVLKGENSFLIIGGGNNKYICSLVVGEHERFFNLINKNEVDVDCEIELVTGGQAGIFEKRLVNDFENTFSAAFYYLEYEKMNPSLQWEE